MESQGARGLPDICPMCGGTLQLSEGGARAFAGCPALREVTIARHIPQAGRKAFAKCGSVARVFLPRSMEPQIGRLFGRLAKLRIEFVFFGE